MELNYEKILMSLSKKTFKLITSSLKENEDFTSALQKYISEYENEIRPSEDIKFIGISNFIQYKIIQNSNQEVGGVDKIFREVNISKNYSTTLDHIKNTIKDNLK